jgi:hypothetical protein
MHGFLHKCLVKRNNLRLQPIFYLKKDKKSFFLLNI